MFSEQKMTLGNASVTCAGKELKISTGILERTWELTDCGLLTTQVRDLQSGTNWQNGERSLSSDWLLPLASQDRPNGWISRTEASDVSIRISDDDGFTSEHLEAVVEFSYPDDKLRIRFSVWVYPDSPGIRTQLSARTLDGFVFETERATSSQLVGFIRCDSLPISFDGTTRRMIGLYGETQQRNDTFLDLLQEATKNGPMRGPEFCTWANALCVETDTSGIALVKESHKFINQNTHDTGLFTCDPIDGLQNCGWGLLCGELTEVYRPSWATWCIAYGNCELAAQTAFKCFDRLRYPIDPDRDVYVQANTWGSSYSGDEHREAANEKNVLRELESCADLGIDILQIDDGWQGNQYEEWVPTNDRYPEGWTNVRRRAAGLGIRLGLWAAAQPVSLGDLVRAWKEGGFVSYKLDFANLNTRQKIEDLMLKTRAFITETGHKVRINWDLTEISPRSGYFFAREYGHVYLENRKPVMPKSATYKPHTVLRDLWQLAKYVNLLKFQGSVQNVERVNRGISDAWLHPHDYCLAITLMSTPLFFQQTLYYSEDARQQLRPLLKVYKEHRDAIYSAIVYPIGSKPNNASWTGFQAHDHDNGSGHLTIFRELNSTESSTSLQLRFVAGKKISLTDLMSGKEHDVTAGAHGEVEFEIDIAPGYRFMRYE